MGAPTGFADEPTLPSAPAALIWTIADAGVDLRVLNGWEAVTGGATAARREPDPALRTCPGR
jgi:hypothetical protein